MKPCLRNRQSIASLAMDTLDARDASALRGHLENCAGCRAYLGELSNVVETLDAVEPRSDIQTSETFHQKVTAGIRAEPSLSVWRIVAAWVGALRVNWRVALPVLAATGMVIAALPFLLRRPTVSLPAPATVQAMLTPRAKAELAPSISNYQMVANRSLEKLDELLTRQGNRNPSPAPVYTASALARANALD